VWAVGVSSRVISEGPGNGCALLRTTLRKPPRPMAPLHVAHPCAVQARLAAMRTARRDPSRPALRRAIAAEVPHGRGKVGGPNLPGGVH
jgi:hypothetical protein